MEQLQQLLKNYNRKNQLDFSGMEWPLQYCSDVFPSYWKIIFSIVKQIPKDSRVLEIGSGLGFVTSILLYRGFSNVVGYERDKGLAEKANRRLHELFDSENVIMPENYSNQKGMYDVVILANCVYPDGIKSKIQYIDLIKEYFKNSGEPQYFIIEVIDSSFTKQDMEFPEYIRLSSDDIESMFPTSKINSWTTYKYPINKKSKTLYCIETI